MDASTPGPVAVLQSYWRERRPYQTFLVLAAVILFTSGVAHAVIFLASHTPWDGPVSWRKPTLFGFSVGVTCIALAWVMTFLPHRRRFSWALAGAFGAASLAEVFLITLQRWRGVPSHFNFRTNLDATIFVFMGVFVMIMATTIVVLMVWCLRSLRAPTPSLGWSIKYGMVLLVVGQLLGGTLVAVGTARTGNGQNDPRVFGPSGVIFGHAGVMKDPHAIALHAIEVIPALAWLALFTGWDERARRSATYAVGAGYTGLLAVNLFQVFSGSAPLALNTAALVVLLLSLGTVVGSYVVVALAAMRHEWKRSPRSGAGKEPLNVSA
jgi:hypothetical protein